MSVIYEYLLHGILHPSPLFLIIFILTTSLLTLLAVSCYLHRSQTHRAVMFVEPINHFFRFILYMFTGMVTKEWVAIHRKHHAFCDAPEDPHSPRYFGIRKVFFEGADIYREVGKNNPELMKTYADGTPDDFVERNVYGGKRRYLGISITLVLELSSSDFPHSSSGPSKCSLFLLLLQGSLMVLPTSGGINAIKMVK